jgi:antitoxin component YwqK of YwqJK toxin-antitoxin module
MTPDFWNTKPDGIHITDQIDSDIIVKQEEWKNNNVIKFETWYTDNNNKCTKECVFKYKNNRKDGKCTFYYENESLKYIHNYKQGLQHNVQLGYYKGPVHGKGQLKYREEWKNGLKHGKCVWYYLDNLIDTIYEYMNGEYHGICKGYYKRFHEEDVNKDSVCKETNQLLRFVKYYDHGKLNKTIEYNMFGKITFNSEAKRESELECESVSGSSDDDSLFGDF